MLDNPRILFETIIAPLISAQTLVVVVIYFTIVRKRIAVDYKLYVCFLLSFIFFIVGKTFQFFVPPVAGFYILLSRMFLFFSVGIPSLLVATALQSSLKKSRTLFIIPYGTGFLISILYIAYLGVVYGHLAFLKPLLAIFPFPVEVSTVHGIQTAGAVLMLIVPCVYLIIRSLNRNKSRRLLLFLCGTLSFGILFVTGTLIKNGFGIYYIGSIFSAVCWAWAVFLDIREMKGDVSLLKDEIQQLVRFRNTAIVPDLEKLLSELRALSNNDLEIYKMRIREILLTLTDVTIEAGGDSGTLLQRNVEKSLAIEKSSDPEAIQSIACNEAVELAEIIADIPNSRINELVENAKTYIQENYDKDLGIEAIAESQGYSRSHFMREFKKGAGLTVNQYITSVRIDAAKKLLVSMSVTDTAFRVGFNNSGYFSTVFKKQTGMSPAAFQESLKK